MEENKKTGLTIKQMIELARQGVSASDVLALNKAGYTPEIMKELEQNGMQSDEVKQQAEEKQSEREEQQKKLEQYELETEILNKKLEDATNTIEALKKQIESIQAQNRGNDMSGDLGSDEDNLKDVTEYVSSLM